MGSEASFAVQAEEHVDLDGTDALLRVQTFQPEGVAVPLFQAQCLTVVPTSNPKCADLVVAHATCLAAHAEKYGAVFRAIFDSMRFPVDGGHAFRQV